MADRPPILDNPFPPPSAASPDGIVAVGAAPSPELLKIAYQQGIFPWPHRGMPLLWFSPDPRFVIEPTDVHVSRSLRKRMRKNPFHIRADTAFIEVMRGCGAVPRPGQDGTWITHDMMAGYTQLHDEGFAHSIEAWLDGQLVGGLYGVSFGSAFFGESMFARVDDASKIAFATLVGHLVDWGMTVIDCQTYTDHLARFGAHEIPRDDFLARLARALEDDTRPGPWTFDMTSSEALDRILQADDSE